MRNPPNKKVSILGCGWLGLPLAEKLLLLGYQVNGSTTSPEKIKTLQDKNIQPFLINLADQAEQEDLVNFLAADFLIISFPPRIRAGNGESYLNQIRFLSQLVQKHAPDINILFISSTSVYADVNKVIKEEDLTSLIPDSPLSHAESLIKQGNPGKTIILRFGGLVGGLRHPGRFLAGKTDVVQPMAPVNLIHLDDCIELCCRIIVYPFESDVFHAAADEHPTRQEFYTKAAEPLQLQPPRFSENQNLSFKIIDSSKIKKAYQYQFIHPDPMLFF